MADRVDILTTLADDLPVALPYHRDGTVVIPVQLDSYDNFFKSLFYSVMSYVYPNSNTVPADVISEEDFLYVCKFFLKVRLDFVYSRVFGALLSDRSVIPGTHMPTSLYGLLRKIGVVTIYEGNVKIVPKPEGVLEARAPMAAPRTFARFSAIIESFPNRRWSTASPSLTESELGTPFWTLSARENNNIGTLAFEQHSVVVLSSFPDWSSEDAVLAAIAQNGFDGNVGEYGLLYRSDIIKDALLLRQRFHLKVG